MTAPDGVDVAADADLAVAVDLRGEPAARLEHLARQRLEQPVFPREVLPDRAGARAQSAPLVGQIPSVDQLVQLRQRGGLENGGEVVAAEVPDLPLDTALLMSALDAGPAVEGFDTPVRAKRGPPVGLHPGP